MERACSGYRGDPAVELNRFTKERSTGLAGPAWLTARRIGALDLLATSDPPSDADENWRYSGIDALDFGLLAPPSLPGTSLPGTSPLRATEPATSPPGASPPFTPVTDLVRKFGISPSITIVIRDGRLASIEVPEDGPPAIGVATCTQPSADLLGAGDVPTAFSARYLATEPAALKEMPPPEWPDLFTALHDAFDPGPVLIAVPEGTEIDKPIAVLQLVTGQRASNKNAPDDSTADDVPVTITTLAIELGASSRASVIEIAMEATTLNAGESREGASGTGDGAGSRSVVLPATYQYLGEGATLGYVGLQILPGDYWQVGRLASCVQADAKLSSLSISLGGRYARLVTESMLAGRGSSSELLALYFGNGSQVHDMRTVQQHGGSHTKSNLLFQGAVGGEARSVYSGLIRVLNGAVKSDAFQTNRNLILSDGARADSVPNLDIQENDVKCSHASSIGPIDPDQVYYLETRGIHPDEARRLVVTGFFREIVGRSPVSGIGEWLQAKVERHTGPSQPAATQAAGDAGGGEAGSDAPVNATGQGRQVTGMSSGGE